MTRKKYYRFSTILEYISGAITHTGIVIPEQTLEELSQPKRIRVEGTINGTPFNLAIQHLKDGRRFLMVGNALRREAGLKAGDMVNVKFTPANPDEVQLPEELTEVLEQDPEGKAYFTSLTPGMQRSLSHYVTSVKNTDSRIRRALDLIHRGKNGLLNYQKNSKNT